MSSYGITSTGFAIKSLEEILNELNLDAQAAFGTDLDISTNSPEGQFIGNIANKFALQWELLLALYSMFNPDSAEGVALDAMCAGNGVIRLPATAALVPVLHYGLSGTVIPAGELIQDTALNNYALQTAITLGINSVGDVSISCPVVTAGALYVVTIGSTSVTYTAQAGDTATVVYTVLKNEINALPTISPVQTAFIDSLSGLLRIQAVDGGFTPFSISVSSNLTIASFGTPGNYQRSVIGAYQPAANTLTIIAQAVSGLTSINNIVGGTAGTNIETDDQLRTRRISLLISKASSSEAVIANSVKAVSGVTYANCVSNRTDSVDAAGRPAHSFEVTVLGGSSPAIAQAIWNAAPPGIQFYGNTSYTIIDSSGNSQVVSFTRPTPIYIWIQVAIVHSTKISLPTNFMAAIQTYIMNWATSNQNVNEDVAYQAINGPVFQCPGVASISSLTIGQSSSMSVPPSSYQAANIAIGIRQLPIFDPSMITVTMS